MKKHKLPKINYIWNKERLAEWIVSYFPSDAKSIFDAFSWWTSISYEAKKIGLKVYSNDILKINYYLAHAFIENNNKILNSKDIETIFSWNMKEWFMYKNYSNKFFFPEECMELDLYRENIKKLKSKAKQSIALWLLRRSMIRKMPYSRFTLPWEKIVQLRDEEYSYKKYKRRRAYHNKSFKYHFIDNLNDYNNAIFDNWEKNKAYNENIFDIVGKVKADIIYLDPPYTGTMNNYFGFYGIIDEYIEEKKLEPFEHNFIDKKESLILFDKLFSNLKNFKYWFLSYNNSSYPSKEQLVEIISKYSDNIKIIEKKHNYKITWKENKNNNKEFLFIIENKKK